MNKEVNTYKAEQESAKLALNSSKEAFSSALNGKLGEDIIHTLDNPEKPSKWRNIKKNIKKVLNI